MRKKPSFQALLQHISFEHRILIQTHDFPDLDAIAAAFGLQTLFKTHELTALIVCKEEIQGFSLNETVRTLRIKVNNINDIDLQDTDQIIMVDSCPGNKNVTLVSTGRIVAVIDHHPVPSHVIEIPYWDIRDKGGACSTIIYDYFSRAKLFPPKNVATILLMGIMMDTNYLSRGVGKSDLTAFNALYFKADWVNGNYLLNNSLSVKNIPAFQEGLANLKIYKGFCFTFISQETESDTIAVMADDYLRFHEVEFSVVAGLNQGKIKISARSEDSVLAASQVVRRALDGIGYGGGHYYMGGGTIDLDKFQSSNDLYERFRSAIDYLIREAT